MNYTVTFSPGTYGSGDGYPPVTWEDGSGGITLPGAVFSRPGYEQVGWGMGDSGEGLGTIDFELGGSCSETVDLTLYPAWQPAVYYVTLDANGGDFADPQSPKPVQFGDLYGVDALGGGMTPGKEGYVFVGWWTAPTGGVQVTASTEVTTPADHTLYARWHQEDLPFTVTLDPDGGYASTTSVQVLFGDPLPPLGSGLPVRTGFDFVGYFTQEGGLGVKYYDSEGDAVGQWDEEAEDTTLYAAWTGLPYQVTLHTGGGVIGSEGDVTGYLAGVRTGLPQDVALPGKTFLGWFTADGDGGVKISGISPSAVGDKEYWARWADAGTPVPEEPGVDDSRGVAYPALTSVMPPRGSEADPIPEFSGLGVSVLGGSGWMKNYLTVGTDFDSISTVVLENYTVSNDARIPSDYGVQPNITCNEFGLYDGSIQIAARWDTEAAGQRGKLNVVFHSWYHSEKSLALGANARGVTSTITTRWFASISGRGRALLNTYLTGDPNAVGVHGYSFYAGCHVSFHPITQVWNVTLATGWEIQTHGAGLEGD